MSGHTPGPWTFRPNPCECPDCTASHWIDGPPDAPGATLGKPIADVREYHKGESEANARLIASAPELFAVLDELLSYIGHDCDVTSDPKQWCRTHDMTTVDGVCPVTRAATVMLKARGGA